MERSLWASFLFRRETSIMLHMKLLVFDVDATLVYHGGSISERNKSAIQSCLDQGDVMAIASGRESRGIGQYLSQFQGTRYAIGADGAAIYDADGCLLFQDGFPFSEFASFRERHRSFLTQGGAIYAYSQDGTVVAFEPSDWTNLEIKFNHIPVRIVEPSTILAEPNVLKVMITGPKEIVTPFPITPEEENHYHFVRSDPCFLEMLKRDVDKATAVEWLRQKLGIPKEQVYTFGDEENDVGMIKAYQGIAMGNAIPAAKDVAKFVTKDVREDGVAYAITHWVSA